MYANIYKCVSTYVCVWIYMGIPYISHHVIVQEEVLYDPKLRCVRWLLEYKYSRLRKHIGICSHTPGHVS